MDKGRRSSMFQRPNRTPLCTSDWKGADFPTRRHQFNLGADSVRENICFNGPFRWVHYGWCYYISARILYCPGEMYSRSSNPNSPPCQLPRANGIAYAAQEPWILNDTIKVSEYFRWCINIPHTPARTILCLARYLMKIDTRQVRIKHFTWSFWPYRIIVLEQCSLKPDISRFEAGDMTAVGEKGVTLRWVW